MLGTAKMRMLDTLVPPSLFHRDKLVKIDFEGMELKALRGMVERFLIPRAACHGPTAIFLELAFFAGAARDELISFLEAHRYESEAANLGGATDAVFVLRTAHAGRSIEMHPASARDASARREGVREYKPSRYPWH